MTFFFFFFFKFAFLLNTVIVIKKKWCENFEMDVKMSNFPTISHFKRFVLFLVNIFDFMRKVR